MTAAKQNPATNAGQETDVFSLLSGKSAEVRKAARNRIDDIRKVTDHSRFLALNAMIEATRAGALGAGFSVVAREVREVSATIEKIANGLDNEIGTEVDALIKLCSDTSRAMQYERLVDLALNAIEIIDRNLYERTCDVRWWATDSAIVACADNPSEENAAHASERLAVILKAYTVYLDLWIIDREGKIVANGRPDRYAVKGQSVKGMPWFAKALALRSGDDYSVADINTLPLLLDAQTATYCAAIHEGGTNEGRAIGTLAIHFDWEPQAQAIVKGVRLTPAEQKRCRVLLVDAAHRIIASTNGAADFKQTFKLDLSENRNRGYYQSVAGEITAYHLTPGYETYPGLGWYGVITET